MAHVESGWTQTPRELLTKQPKHFSVGNNCGPMGGRAKDRGGGLARVLENATPNSYFVINLPRWQADAHLLHGVECIAFRGQAVKFSTRGRKIFALACRTVAIPGPSADWLMETTRY